MNTKKQLAFLLALALFSCNKKVETKTETIEKETIETETTTKETIVSKPIISSFTYRVISFGVLSE